MNTKSPTRKPVTSSAEKFGIATGSFGFVMWPFLCIIGVVFLNSEPAMKLFGCACLLGILLNLAGGLIGLVGMAMTIGSDKPADAKWKPLSIFLLNLCQLIIIIGTMILGIQKSGGFR